MTPEEKWNELRRLVTTDRDYWYLRRTEAVRGTACELSHAQAIAYTLNQVITSMDRLEEKEVALQLQAERLQ